ncbi:hypothetical protein GCM10020366_64230 [Saccharopolyspora gregorii]|uniref:Uncharacterized protein n=1 Tax=Saccharopolyspora gregorii TaxID=33914 RepID=A0ABP6S0Z7_9PSEU
MNGHIDPRHKVSARQSFTGATLQIGRASFGGFESSTWHTSHNGPVTCKSRVTGPFCVVRSPDDDPASAGCGRSLAVGPLRNRHVRLVRRG